MWAYRTVRPHSKERETVIYHLCYVCRIGYSNYCVCKRVMKNYYVPCLFVDYHLWAYFVIDIVSVC